MNYLAMTKSEIANGEGIRVCLWVSGCEHHCKNCQNPESWDCEAGKPFTGEDFNRLVKELKSPYYDGLTLTGGDPLHPKNIKIIEYVAFKIKELFSNKSIWCYTGYNFEDVKNESIMQYIDVLVDGVYIDSKRDITLAFRGSTNQRVIDVQKSLKENKVILKEEV